MFISHLPRVLQRQLDAACELLSRPQRRHLMGFVMALLLGVGAKLQVVSRWLNAAHRTSLGLFLNTSTWDPADVLARHARSVLKQLRLRKNEPLELLLDDTKIVKRAHKMAGVSKLYDSAHKRFAYGHTVLLLAVRVRDIVLPVAVRIWRAKSAAGQAYRKLTDLAAEMIAQWEPPMAGVRVRVLFDAYYLCAPVTKACEQRGFLWYSVAAKNRVCLNLTTGQLEKLQDLAPGLLKHHGANVRMKRSRGWRRMRIAGRRTGLKKIGLTQLVLSRRPGDPRGKFLAIATNDLRSRPRQILEIYERRWWIEVLIKELRKLGLGAYQMLHWNGIQRHLHLVCLAHGMLTHHALRALGAPAQALPTTVLPTLDQRLRNLRADIQAQRRSKIMQEIRQIKCKRLRKKLQDYLNSAA